jgi:hypothetical protein
VRGIAPEAPQPTGIARHWLQGASEESSDSRCVTAVFTGACPFFRSVAGFDGRGIGTNGSVARGFRSVIGKYRSVTRSFGRLTGPSRSVLGNYGNVVGTPRFRRGSGGGFPEALRELDGPRRRR